MIYDSPKQFFEFSQDDKEASLLNINKMGREGLVPVSFAYKKVPLAEVEQLM
jgi:hypothetical protein